MSQQESTIMQVLQDLRSGLDDTTIMARNNLSYLELRTVYKRLFDTGLLTGTTMAAAEDIPETPVIAESSGPDEPSNGDDLRSIRRQRLNFEMTVYDQDDPDNQGKLTNITEEGIGLVGVEAGVDEEKNLVVLGDAFGDVAPFEFRARCRWAERSDDEENVVAGFEITQIGDQDSHELRKLIRPDVA